MENFSIELDFNFDHYYYSWGMHGRSFHVLKIGFVRFEWFGFPEVEN